MRFFLRVLPGCAPLSPQAGKILTEEDMVVLNPKQDGLREQTQTETSFYNFVTQHRLSRACSNSLMHMLRQDSFEPRDLHYHSMQSGSTRRRATQHSPWDLLTCLKRYDGINNIARSSCLQFKQYSTKLLSPILATRFRQTLTMCCLWAAYWWNSRRKLALSLMNRSSGAICRTRHVCLDECVKYALPQCVDKLTWTYLDLYYNNKNYNNKKKLRRINLFYNKNINLKIDSNTCMGR